MFRQVAAVLIVSLLTACQTTTPKRATPEDSPWVQATGSLKAEIKKQADALPWTHGRERVELISWFAVVGEPAYDELLDYLDDERPEVVATALAALGATGDSRLVEPLRQAEHPDWSEVLKLESARARVRLGDWTAMPVLIDGLASEEFIKRALCVQVLKQATREDKGYDPNGTPEERAEAVQRWRAWWTERQSDKLLAGSK
jgi:HEAT repeat protein